MSTRGIVVALLVLLALGSSVAAWLLREPQAEAIFVGPLRSDYSLRDYTLVALDQYGVESFTVRGPQLARDPNTGTLALDKPVFQFPQNGGDPTRPVAGPVWETRSEDGWVSARGDEVRLSRGVQVDGPPGRGGARTRLVSERMTVKPKVNRAYTDADVTISDRGSILRARGMELDMNTRRYQLLSAVRGNYEKVPR